MASRLFLILISFVIAEAPSVREIAYVIEAGGSWLDAQYSEKLTPLYVLRHNSRLVRTSSRSTADFLRVRLLDTGKEIRFDCREPLSCNEPLNLVGQVQQSERTDPPSEVHTFLKLISGLLSNGSGLYRGYASLTARPTPSFLLDAVLLLEPNGVNLKEVFGNMGPGSFLVELCPVNPDGNPKCGLVPNPRPFSWKPGENALWQSSDLSPGLYKLNVCEKIDGRILRSPDSVFVLAAQRQSYQGMHAQFSKAVRETQSWSTTDPAAAILLRVYMHYLSLHPGR